jgi:hypothetical protein
VNGHLGKKGQRQALDFHFLSGVLFEIGNYLWPVAIQVEENRRQQDHG